MAVVAQVVLAEIVLVVKMVVLVVLEYFHLFQVQIRDIVAAVVVLEMYSQCQVQLLLEHIIMVVEMLQPLEVTLE